MKKEIIKLPTNKILQIKIIENTLIEIIISPLIKYGF